ncbi:MULTISPECIES: phage tail assembly protein [unclassified Novosphingobium]|uniref:phage tail assembly protein n=1 Tax=unclassified Novosphingobium TaxID=2644732 RepID=UPI001356D9D2|nr:MULTISPECIES: phage tail assembly protein [unclassified Novosphingobium]
MSEANTPELRTVTLDQPFKRGEETIGTVQVRTPRSGELRGTNLNALLNLNYDALEIVLPRITVPILSKQDVAALHPADLTQFATEVMDFLLPKGAKAGLSQHS